LPGDIGAAYRKELAAGAGCCSAFNTDRDNIPPPVPAELTPMGTELDRQVKVLLKHLGNGFISGDAIWLALNSASRELGKDWKAAALSYIKEMRHKHVEEFMG
jgi:hypothetical protein